MTTEKTLNELIEYFKPVNPLYTKLFSNKTERSELELFVKKLGYEKAIKVLEEMPTIMKEDKFMQDFSISKPSELNRKFNLLCNAKNRILEEKKKKATPKYKEVANEELTEEEREKARKKLAEIRNSFDFLKK